MFEILWGLVAVMERGVANNGHETCDLRGPISVAADQFRDAMARLASGVGVLMVRDVAGRDCGFTATALSSLSLEPPLVLACVRRNGFFRDALLASAGWTLTMLAEDQVDLANYAARHRYHGDRDDFSRWPRHRSHRTDTLAFTGGVAAVECVPHSAIDAGDHTVAIGRVVTVADKMTGGYPLVYVDRGYRRLADGWR